MYVSNMAPSSDYRRRYKLPASAWHEVDAHV